MANGRKNTQRVVPIVERKPRRGVRRSVAGTGVGKPLTYDEHGLPTWFTRKTQFSNSLAERIDKACRESEDKE